MFPIYVGKRSRSRSDVTHELKWWKVKFNLNSWFARGSHVWIQPFPLHVQLPLNLCTSGQCHVCFCSVFLSANKAIVCISFVDDRSVWNWLFFKAFLDLKPIQKGPEICFNYSSDLWLRKLKNRFSIPAVIFSQYCATTKVETDTFVLEVWDRKAVFSSLVGKCSEFWKSAIACGECHFPKLHINKQQVVNPYCENVTWNS